MPQEASTPSLEISAEDWRLVQSLGEVFHAAPERMAGSWVADRAHQVDAELRPAPTEETPRLTRQQASDAVEAIGWRYLLGTLSTTVTVASVSAAARLATTIAAACGSAADAHLRLDLRPDRVEVSLQTRAVAAVTQRDADLAHAISSVVETRWNAGPHRPVQALEIAIDALDIAGVVPFWRAVMGYADDPGSLDGDALVDPAGQQPTIWFQQMDAPREQRNRIHFDLTVAHDEAARRVAAALAAGGTLLDDSYARSFWILADAEGNEVCVCTWQDRDQRQPIAG